MKITHLILVLLSIWSLRCVAQLGVFPPTSSGAGTVTYGSTAGTATEGNDPRVTGTLPVSYGLMVFGDSIACSTGPTTLANGFAHLMRLQVGGEFNDHCRPGDMTADQNYQRIFASTNPLGSGVDPLYVEETGTNDAINYNSNVSKQFIFRRLKLASASWLGTPASTKVFGQAATITSGTWVDDNSPQNKIARSSVTNGSVLAFNNITTSVPNQVIYLWYLIADGNGGTFNIRLDGALQTDPFNATTTFYSAGDASAAIATPNGVSSGIAAVRIVVPTAGNHSLSATVTSATSASNIVSLWAVGVSPAVKSTGSPYVVLVSPNHQNSANDAISGTFSGYVASIATTLASDNENIIFADTRTALGTAYATYYADSLHPNNAGHALMASTISALLPSVKLTKNFVPNLSQPSSAYSLTDAINPSQYWRPNPNNLFTHGWGRGIAWMDSQGQTIFSAYLFGTGFTTGFPANGGATNYCIYAYTASSARPPSILPTPSDCVQRIDGNGTNWFGRGSTTHFGSDGKLGVGAGHEISNSDNIMQTIGGPLTTTAAASDNVSGIYVNSTSTCQAIPQNAAAAAMTGVFAVWTSDYVITVYHPATAAAIFRVACSVFGQY